MLINGAWEIKKDRIICRWMIVWEDIDESFMIGCLAGYSGGGAFQLEKFNLKYKNERLIKLQIDNHNILSDEYENFSRSLDAKEVDISENCQDEILRWHYEADWFENDNLILRQENKLFLERDKDLLFLSKDKNIFIKTILQNAGINASPT
jgi:hypothetical protein